MRQPIFNIEDIRAVLPHREPFLFVDRVVAFTAGKSLEAERELRSEEPHFQGHFPGNPIMPGVLVTEAMAQASGLLLAFSGGAGIELAPSGAMGYLASANVKFTAPALPGETLEVATVFEKKFGALYGFSVEARSGRKNVAKGGLTLAMLPAGRATANI